MAQASLTLAARRGRPRRMSHADVATVALDLFARDGFDQTTVDDIAEALGVGRRTLFRYFPSKNDIVWGDFDWVLARLRHHLNEASEDLPLMNAISHAAIESNRYGRDELPELRIRMTLITTVPALQGHSMLRYASWRTVISEFAAQRLGQRPDDLLPLTIGYAALGASMAAYSRWVEHPTEDLEENLRTAYAGIASGFAHRRMYHLDTASHARTRHRPF
jgi:mycofactocin system transcriptional regulator